MGDAAASADAGPAPDEIDDSLYSRQRYVLVSLNEVCVCVCVPSLPWGWVGG